MGKKSSYFRHSFNAHSDDKILRLIDKRGLAGVGAYFILLEIYGLQISDDDEEKVEQKIHLRRIATALGLRSDSARSVVEVMAELELIEAVWDKSDLTSVQVAVPNFMKYYGSYSKATDLYCPNKRKEKESKTKESKVKEDSVPPAAKASARPAEPSGAISLFSWSDFQKEILAEVKVKLQEKWLELYGQEFLIEEFGKVEVWVLTNPHKAPKKYAQFLTNWFSRGWEQRRKGLPSNQNRRAIKGEAVLNYKNPYPEN